MNSALRFAAPLVLASLVLTLGACKPAGKDDKAEPAADGTAATATAAGDAVVADIPGLDTERKQVSYMIGMDMAKSLDPIKDTLDVDVLADAMRAAFAGEKSKLTDEQSAKIQEAFTAKLQAKQEAEQAAKAEKGKTEGAAFLAANKDKPGIKVTESGLQYQVVRAGTGAVPVATDTVRVHYKGTLLDGTVFDSSYERGQPAEFGLAKTIP